MAIEAWIIDDNTKVSPAELAELGVLHYVINADDYEEELSKISQERGYGHRSIVNINKEAMPDLEQKLQMFFEEHLHEFEEIRFFLEGSGYFDVRDKQERWVRIHVKKNDLLVLPAGIYHRFTLDENKSAKAMRLFVNTQPEPVWTPLNRTEAITEETSARRGYVSTFLQA